LAAQTFKNVPWLRERDVNVSYYQGPVLKAHSFGGGPTAVHIRRKELQTL
jgi:hypothetical protein